MYSINGFLKRCPTNDYQISIYITYSNQRKFRVYLIFDLKFLMWFGNNPIQLSFIYFSISDNNFNNFILWHEIIFVPWRLPVNTLSINFVTFYQFIRYLSRPFEASMLVTWKWFIITFYELDHIHGDYSYTYESISKDIPEQF